MSSVEFDLEESKNLISEEKIIVSQQLHAKNSSTNETNPKQINFFILLGSLIFSLLKLFGIILSRIAIFPFTLIKPMIKKIVSFIKNNCKGQSLSACLQHAICVIASLEHKVPEFMDQIVEMLRSNKNKNSLPFSEKKQFTDQELKKMFLEPANHLQSPSNQVLCKVKQGKKKQTITYYVPTYLRVLLKNITSIDLAKLQAEVNANIIITFVYGNNGLLKLPKQVANRLNNEVVLNFQRDQPLRLTAEDGDHVSIKQEEQKSYITFTVRRKFRMKIQSDVAYTPFERLDLLFPVTIQQITAATIQSPQDIYSEQFLKSLKKDTIIEAGIKFNFMDNPAPFVKLDFKDETGFGNYSIIESGLQTNYSDKKILSKDQEQKKKIQFQKQRTKFINESKKLQRKKQLLGKLIYDKQKKVLAKQIQILQNRIDNKLKLTRSKTYQKEEKKKDPDNFQYACFKIPIFKHPFASLIEIFLPLWSLGIINLGIYFEDSALSDRIGSIGGVMIAFMALIPLIRSEIPPSPKVVFVQYLVYMQIFSSLLCLIDSFIIRGQSDYNMIWFEDIFFLISLVIFLFQIIAIALLSFNHYVIHLHSYELDQDEQEWKKDKGKNKFNHFLWGNKDCDKKFVKIISQTKLQANNMVSSWEGKLHDINQNKKPDIKELTCALFQQLGLRKSTTNSQSLVSNLLT